MATKPGYMLVHTLYEESGANVSWENTADAQYQLDIVYNEDFDKASSGKRWSDIDLYSWSWNDQTGQNGISWSEIETLPAQGLMWRNIEFKDKTWEQWDLDKEATWQWMHQHPVEFTSYRGEGEDTPAPDQGLAWCNIDNTMWSWGSQQEDNGFTWKEISIIPSKGLEWWQHDHNEYSWEDFEQSYSTWKDYEDVPTQGLSWKSLNGRWHRWSDFEKLGAGNDGLTWRELETLPPDNKTQKGAPIDTPLYTKRSMMRVRSIDKDENPSEYLTTSMRRHEPRSLKKYAVPCLEIPTLYEGRQAEITWGNLYGASKYVIERKLDSGYEHLYFDTGELTEHPSDCKKPDELYYEPDCKVHLSTMDQIPLYHKTAKYRIKGCNTTDHSQWLESEAVTIIPVFYRDDKINLSVLSDSEYIVQLNAKEINNWNLINMIVRYDSNILSIIDDSNSLIDSGKKTGNFTIIKQSPGEIQIRCNPAANLTQQWSGLVLPLRFKALKTANTAITLA